MNFKKNLNKIFTAFQLFPSVLAPEKILEKGRILSSRKQTALGQRVYA